MATQGVSAGVKSLQLYRFSTKMDQTDKQTKNYQTWLWTLKNQQTSICYAKILWSNGVLSMNDAWLRVNTGLLTANVLWSAMICHTYPVTNGKEHSVHSVHFFMTEWCVWWACVDKLSGSLTSDVTALKRREFKTLCKAKNVTCGASMECHTIESWTSFSCLIFESSVVIYFLKNNFWISHFLMNELHAFLGSCWPWQQYFIFLLNQTGPGRSTLPSTFQTHIHCCWTTYN